MKAEILSVCLALSCLVTLPAYAKDKHSLQTAKVTSQDIDSYNTGAAVMPMFGGLVGVPITKRSNTVLVETDDSYMAWSEVGRNTIVLPVGGTVRFYQDKGYFVVLDSQNRKHRFALTHLEAKTHYKVE